MRQLLARNPSLDRMNAGLDRAWAARGGPDVPFDEFLNVSEERQNNLEAWIAPMLDGGRKRARKAKVGPLLGCICANAIVAMETGGPGARVQYSRAKTSYVGETIYKPKFLTSKQLVGTVDGMISAGLLVGRTGDRGSPGRELKQSTYWPTSLLLDGMRDQGVTAASTERSGEAPVVFLFDQKRSLQSYDAAALEVASKIANVRAYNTFIAAQTLALNLPADASVTPAPNLRATSLRRQFNGSFDEHGRFYGGWWQNFPKDARRFITINGAATVELDYASFVARVLYHQERIDYVEDAYEIPEIKAASEADGMAWEEVRPVVKQVFAYMLNAKSRGGHMGSDAFIGLPASISRKDAMAAVERAHAPIKDHFFKQEALVLMKLDSDICEAVIMAGVEASITVLPIHDSFIVDVKHEDWLRNQMIKAYQDKLGFDPIIV